MGISDSHYFGWLCEAIEGFDGQSRRLSVVGAASGGTELWVLAGSVMNASIELTLQFLGRETRVHKFNLYLLTVLEPVGK